MAAASEVIQKTGILQKAVAFLLTKNAIYVKMSVKFTKIAER